VHSTLYNFYAAIYFGYYIAIISKYKTPNYLNNIKMDTVKGKGKVHPRTGHEGQRGRTGIALIFL
jgi:hypothetical protein